MRKEETVKLISAEGFEFVIDMEAAMYSHTIRQMLTSPGGFAESHNREVRFPEIGASILEKVCQYFYWALHHQGEYISLYSLHKSPLIGSFRQSAVAFLWLYLQNQLLGKKEKNFQLTLKCVWN